MLGRFFQSDPDIRITGTEIYLDPAESRPIGVVSHAHSDHIGRHGHFVATTPTADLMRLRLGRALVGTELQYRERLPLGGLEIELFPAGHVLGSAMVRVTRDGESLLYTGDFKLRPALTCDPAEVPCADSVIIESTYGHPDWVFPPAEELREQLLALIRTATARNRTVVLLAYSLGKAQEATAMLRGSGPPVVLHPSVASLSEVYERHGIDLGEWEVWSEQESMTGHRSARSLGGRVLIVPPHLRGEIRRIPLATTILLTGWALHRGNLGADYALPMSDHADFPQLLELVDRSQAKSVYVTHGARRLAAELRDRGFEAEFLVRKLQMRLF